MHEVQVDIEQRGLPFGSSYHVRVPDFFKQSTRHIFSFAHNLPIIQEREAFGAAIGFLR
jgi:hypothetical protein